MPIPTPNAGEEQSGFVSRCMSFLDDEGSSLKHEQRIAACYAKWRSAKGIKSSEGTMPDSRLALFSSDKNYEKISLKLSDVRMWRKQVLQLGMWRHPEDKDVQFEITPEVIEQVVANFNAGVPGIAPVTATHTDDPRAKLGEVKSFVVTPTGLDAIFTVDDDKLNENIASSEKAPGVSCWLNLNYQHKQSGDKIGAVVKHVALVNHPYIEGMEGFQAVLSEAADEDKDCLPLVYLSEKKIKNSKQLEEKVMKKEEMIAKLKEDHSVDVTALLSDSEGLKTLQKRVEDGELVEKLALSEELQKKIREQFKLSEDEEINILSILDKLFEKNTGEETKLSDAIKEIAGLKETLNKKEADVRVEALLSGGFIFPKESESMKELYLSDSKLFEKMDAARREAGTVVKLSEEGTVGDNKETVEEATKRNVEAAQAEGYVAK